MRKTLYIGDHPDIAESLNAISVSYYKLGQFLISLEYAMQALKMNKVLHLSNHPDIVESLVYVGRALNAIGGIKNIIGGLYYLDCALKMLHIIYPEGHSDIERYARSQEFTFEEASQIFRHIVAINYGSNSNSAISELNFEMQRVDLICLLDELKSTDGLGPKVIVGGKILEYLSRYPNLKSVLELEIDSLYTDLVSTQKFVVFSTEEEQVESDQCSDIEENIVINHKASHTRDQTNFTWNKRVNANSKIHRLDQQYIASDANEDLVAYSGFMTPLQLRSYSDHAKVVGLSDASWVDIISRRRMAKIAAEHQLQ